MTNDSYDAFVRPGWHKDRTRWSVEARKTIKERRLPYHLPDSYRDPRQPRAKVTWYEAEWEWAAHGPESTPRCALALARSRTK